MAKDEDGFEIPTIWWEGHEFNRSEISEYLNMMRTDPGAKVLVRMLNILQEASWGIMSSYAADNERIRQCQGEVFRTREILELPNILDEAMKDEQTLK